MFVMASRIERYFLLDHGRQVMLIYKTNDLNQGATANINYNSMVAVIEPERDASQLMERWGFGFRLQTRDRWYQLFAVCEDEYVLWLHTFKWVVHRNHFAQLFKSGAIDSTLLRKDPLLDKRSSARELNTKEDEGSPKKKYEQVKDEENKVDTTDHDDEVKLINEKQMKKKANENSRQSIN